MPQTTVSASPARALPGQIADVNEATIVSARVDATAGIAPGLVVLRTASGDSCAGFPTSIAADDDAICTALATSASQQVLDTEFDGVIATGKIFPPAKISIIRSSHANQDAVTAVLAGLDENGLPVSENISFADGGGDTLTSTLYYSYVLSLTIPAQSGVGGTTKVGTTATCTLDGGGVLGVSVLSATHTLEVTGSNSSCEVHEDDTVMPVLREGRICVAVENAFRAGDTPLVRLVAGVGEILGAVRVHDTDSGDCVAWRRARLVTSGAAGAIGVLEVNLP